MTVDEFVQRLSTVSDANRAIENPYIVDYRRDHLLHYLRHLQANSIDVLLVGEAPGHRGCALTGIPLTDEIQIRQPENFYALGDWERTSNIGDTKEKTASTVWPLLREYHIVPLMWNVFPFHPHENGNATSNRTPTRRELEEGRLYLDMLRTIFPIEDSRVFAVGRKAQRVMGLDDSQYIRHPARDTKGEFKVHFVQKIGEIYGH